MSAGRQINRIRTKYRSVSIYIIYWYAMYVYSECEVGLYLTPDLSICRPADFPLILLIILQVCLYTYMANHILQYNLSNPACYQTEKKIRIRQGAGIERLTYPRDIKVTLVSIGIQHMADNGYVNELYIIPISQMSAEALRT